MTTGGLMSRWRLLMLLVPLVLFGACGGGDGGGDTAADESPDVADGDGGDIASEDENTSKPDFECPVTKADVEEAYAPVKMQEPEVNDGSCTFVREDEIGSVVISVEAKDARAAYASMLATMPDAEKVDGVGDEAVYSEGRTSLLVRSGDKTLLVGAITMIGVGGAGTDDMETLNANLKKAAIEVGTTALDEL